MKKVEKKVEPTVPQIDTTVSLEIVYEQPLSLNLDFGRQDLNENFLKIQEAINKLKKC